MATTWLICGYGSTKSCCVRDIVNPPVDTVSISITVRASFGIVGIGSLLSELFVSVLVYRVVAERIRLRGIYGFFVDLQK